MSFAKGLSAFAPGLVFGIGLGLSGMTQPSRVVGFLDVAGAWDPTMLFVMAGAIAVYVPAYRIITRRKHPVFDAKFWVPTRNDLDRRLFAGAAIFGIGWGIGGICPGPSIAGLLTLSAPFTVFLPAIVFGMVIYSAVTSASQKAIQPSAQPTQVEGCSTDG